jgi:hypothetical protein
MAWWAALVVTHSSKAALALSQGLVLVFKFSLHHRVGLSLTNRIMSGLRQQESRGVKYALYEKAKRAKKRG